MAAEAALAPSTAQLRAGSAELWEGLWVCPSPGHAAERGWRPAHLKLLRKAQLDDMQDLAGAWRLPDEVVNAPHVTDVRRALTHELASCLDPVSRPGAPGAASPARRVRGQRGRWLFSGDSPAEFAARLGLRGAPATPDGPQLFALRAVTNMLLPGSAQYLAAGSRAWAGFRAAVQLPRGAAPADVRAALERMQAGWLDADSSSDESTGSEPSSSDVESLDAEFWTRPSAAPMKRSRAGSGGRAGGRVHHKAPRRHPREGPQRRTYGSASSSDSEDAPVPAPAPLVQRARAAAAGEGMGGRFTLGSHLACIIPGMDATVRGAAMRNLAVLAGIAGSKQLRFIGEMAASIMAAKLDDVARKAPATARSTFVDQDAAGEPAAHARAHPWEAAPLSSAEDRAMHGMVESYWMADGMLVLQLSAAGWSQLCVASAVGGLRHWGALAGVHGGGFIWDILKDVAARPDGGRAPVPQLHHDLGDQLEHMVAQLRVASPAGTLRLLSLFFVALWSVASVTHLAAEPAGAQATKGGTLDWQACAVRLWRQTLVEQGALVVPVCPTARQMASAAADATHPPPVAAAAPAPAAHTWRAAAGAPAAYGPQRPWAAAPTPVGSTVWQPAPAPAAASSATDGPQTRRGQRIAAGAAAGGSAAQGQPRRPRRVKFAAGDAVCAVCMTVGHQTPACPGLKQRLADPAWASMDAEYMAAQLVRFGKRVHADHAGSAPPPEQTAVLAAVRSCLAGNAGRSWAPTAAAGGLAPSHTPPPRSTDAEGMALGLLRAVRNAGSDDVARQQRLAALVRSAEAGGYKRPELGTKPRLRFPVLARAHAEACRACSAAAPAHRNVAACGVMLALALFAVEGWRPAALMTTHAPQLGGGTPATRVMPAYPASAAEAAEVRQRHDALTAAGALFPRSGVGARGMAVAPAFVVEKWSPIHSPDLLGALLAWNKNNPEEVQRFLASQDRPPLALRTRFKLKLRVVYDFKFVNSQTVDVPMTFPLLADTVAKLTPGAELVVIDIADGFTTLPLFPKQRNLLAIVEPREPQAQQGRQRLFAHGRVPFGWRAAPALFCTMSALVLQYIQHRWSGSLVTASCFMDDYLLAFRPGTAAAALAEILAWLEEAGMPAKPEKVVGPQQSLEYLGNLVSTEDGVFLQLPAGKRCLLRWQLDCVLLEHAAGRGIPKRAIMAMTGRLQAAASVLPGSRTRLGAVYSLQRAPRWQVASHSTPIRLASYQHSALAWFAAQLAAPPLRVGGHDGGLQRGQPLSVVAATDAAGTGGLGGWWLASGKRQAHTFSVWCSAEGVQPAADGAIPAEHPGRSTEFELEAVLALMPRVAATASELGFSSVSLALHVDSQASAALLIKGYCVRNKAVNMVLQRVAEAEARLSIDITARWVPRELNWVADALSHPDQPQLAQAALARAGEPANWLLPETSKSGGGAATPGGGAHTGTHAPHECAHAPAPAHRSTGTPAPGRESAVGAGAPAQARAGAGAGGAAVAGSICASDAAGVRPQAVPVPTVVQAHRAAPAAPQLGVSIRAEEAEQRGVGVQNRGGGAGDDSSSTGSAGAAEHGQER